MHKASTPAAVLLAVCITASLVFAQGAWQDRYPVPKNIEYSRRIADIPVPAGFQRPVVDATGMWLRDFPLEKPDAPVRDYTGQAIVPPAKPLAVTAAVVLSKAAQCADMAILLRAKQLMHGKREDSIQFKSVSGQWMKWNYWKNGGRYRLSKNGRKLETATGRAVSKQYPQQQAFEDYLKYVFLYAGSASLHRDLKKIDKKKVLPGDLYVQSPPGGGIGHVSIVFDIAKSKNGETRYLMGYGYIPAMSLFIVSPGTGEGTGGWFSEAGFRQHIAHFGPGVWQRWE